ncbi:MAG: hypothetical protein EOP00_03370 [Pedobacter sp.]|nr:MAG: hypothetical protein EOP00_03370 [Pedobacter sp.]
MRFLIISVLLFCFQSFVVCTREDGAVTIAQKTITKSSSAQLTTLISTKLNTESFKVSTFEFVDRIYQNVAHHFSKAITLTEDKSCLITFATQITKRFKNEVNHSYQFIFNCLYPKHTFW